MSDTGINDTGIGARVPRKEDRRFITGKANFTDDINLKNQTYGYFVHSPYAHATIDAIDAKQARKAPGVIAVLTGEDLAADKIGGLICGWMIHSKDGSPMKVGAHPVLARRKVRYVRDHVAEDVPEAKAQAKNSADLVVVRY